MEAAHEGKVLKISNMTCCALVTWQASDMGRNGTYANTNKTQKTKQYKTKQNNTIQNKAKRMITKRVGRKCLHLHLLHTPSFMHATYRWRVLKVRPKIDAHLRQGKKNREEKRNI